METEWLTINEAARRLGCSADSVRRRLRAGKLWTRREERAHGLMWLIGFAGAQALPAPIEADTLAPIGDPGYAPLGAQLEAMAQTVAHSLAQVERLAGEVGYWRSEAEAARAQLRALSAPAKPRRRTWKFWTRRKETQPWT